MSGNSLFCECDVPNLREDGVCRKCGARKISDSTPLWGKDAPKQSPRDAKSHNKDSKVPSSQTTPSLNQHIASKSPSFGAQREIPAPYETATLKELVAAQNRTTHAVRSLAITFVAAPVVSLLVFVIIALAVKSGNIAVVVVAAIFGLLALLGVLVVSLSELRASRL